MQKNRTVSAGTDFETAIDIEFSGVVSYVTDPSTEYDFIAYFNRGENVELKLF